MDAFAENLEAASANTFGRGFGRSAEFHERLLLDGDKRPPREGDEEEEE